MNSATELHCKKNPVTTKWCCLVFNKIIFHILEEQWGSGQASAACLGSGSSSSNMLVIRLVSFLSATAGEMTVKQPLERHQEKL